MSQACVQTNASSFGQPIFVFLSFAFVPVSHAIVIMCQPFQTVWTASIDVMCTGCLSSFTARCMHITDEDPDAQSGVLQHFEPC